MITCADGDELMEVEDSDEGSSNAPGRKQASRKGATAPKKTSKSVLPHLLCHKCVCLQYGNPELYVVTGGPR